MLELIIVAFIAVIAGTILLTIHSFRRKVKIDMKRLDEAAETISETAASTAADADNGSGVFTAVDSHGMSKETFCYDKSTAQLMPLAGKQDTVVSEERMGKDVVMVEMPVTDADTPKVRAKGTPRKREVSVDADSAKALAAESRRLTALVQRRERVLRAAKLSADDDDVVVKIKARLSDVNKALDEVKKRVADGKPNTAAAEPATKDKKVKRVSSSNTSKRKKPVKAGREKTSTTAGRRKKAK